MTDVGDSGPNISARKIGQGENYFRIRTLIVSVRVLLKQLQWGGKERRVLATHNLKTKTRHLLTREEIWKAVSVAQLRRLVKSLAKG